MGRERNYRKEYLDYYGDSKKKLYRDHKLRIKEKTARNQARALMAKKGRVSKGDGKDVDHKDGNPLNNHPSNLRVLPQSVNRAMNAHRN